MAIHWTKMGVDEVIFQRINPHSQLHTAIAIDRLRLYLEKTKHKTMMVPLERRVCTQYVKLRGIEQHRLLRLTPEYLFKPLIFINDIEIAAPNGGTHDLIDGHHRYVRLFLEGYESCRAFVVQPVVWHQYLIEGLPQATAEELRLARSGIQ